MIMKNPHVCKLTGEASILVPGRAGIMLGPGAVVDFDLVLIPAQPATKSAPARPAYTVRDALGELASSFEPLTSSNVSPAPSTAISQKEAQRRSAEERSAASAEPTKE